jgi:GNAT superfamily N-acetyltransferase
MIELPVWIDLAPANLESLPCCGIKNPDHEGRRQKNCWLNTSFKTGLRSKVLLTRDNRQCGFLEYVPGEHAWRGVDASGYLFIHCIWTFYKKYQGRGLASQAIQACIDDARDSGKNGVAVITREGPWLGGAAVFLANGFTVVETAPPDYSLLVRKLNPSAADPAFRGDWERKLKRYGQGLTIIRSNQCPHIAKFAGEIARAAEEEYGLKPRIVELKSARQAQNAPTPYAVFAVIYNGRLLADHQISLTRFHNIMRRLPARPAASISS